MAGVVEPAALAKVLDAAERPRASEWSLRAALTRYAQPQPVRASAIIELVRRAESALRPFAKVLERDGVAVWSTLEDGSTDPTTAGDTSGVDAKLVELLRAMVELDGLGDVLARWAVAREGARPDGEVDRVVADVTARLERLGVAREERPPRPGARRG
jgi:hypothetical protein